MHILITGGQGFLGQKLARQFLQSSDPSLQLTLVDIVDNPQALQDPRVTHVTADLADYDTVQQLITPQVDVVYHLAAVVSSHAEAEPDTGYRVNYVVTRNLLEAIRYTKPSIRLIFSSSLAVFGGELPEVITDGTAVTPQSTYGTQKAMCELLINDYTRKGFVDGLVLRLPTICIRPGKPNKAASSFVSSIMREPLTGLPAVCPVDPQLQLWLSSPAVLISNLVKALSLPSFARRDWHVVNLPGFTVSVAQMITDLEAVRGTAATALIKYEFDAMINDIVASWPARIDNTKALALGFDVDADFKSVIKQFITQELGQEVA